MSKAKRIPTKVILFYMLSLIILFFAPVSTELRVLYSLWAKVTAIFWLLYDMHYGGE